MTVTVLPNDRGHQQGGLFKELVKQSFPSNIFLLIFGGTYLGNIWPEPDFSDFDYVSFGARRAEHRKGSDPPCSPSTKMPSLRDNTPHFSIALISFFGH